MPRVMTERSEAELRLLLDQATRDEHDLLARQIRFHLIKGLTERDADSSAVAKAMHWREVLRLLDQYARERAPS
jgi:hypothetical protein